MAKRLSDTEKWKDEWFCDLSSKQKLFWLFVLDEVDHAGIWKVNFRYANFAIGETYTKDECIEFLGDRLYVVDEKKWFFPKFIKFQNQKGLSEFSNAQSSVIQLLKENNLLGTVIQLYGNSYVTLKEPLLNSYATVNEPFMNSSKDSCSTVLDKDMDKGKDKEDTTNLASSTIPPLPDNHEEMMDLTRKVAEYFSINESNNIHRFKKIFCFVQFHFDKNKDDWLRIQLRGYWHHKQSSGEIKHGIDSFLGTYDKEYQDGAFYSKDWEKTSNNHKKNGNDWTKEDYENFKRNS